MRWFAWRSLWAVLIATALLFPSPGPQAGPVPASAAPALPVAAGSSDSPSSEPAFGIARYPPPADYGRGRLKAIPSYSPESRNSFQVDLRGYDLSALTLAELPIKDLFWADFDDRTVWPDELPPGFDPAVIMDLGKNPGLGVRGLHELGITGRGIGVAIIDQTLLVDHEEYAGRIRCYEEIGEPQYVARAPAAQMHGPAVASILVGRTTGVAPEADLYYIAALDTGLGDMGTAIDRVIEINRLLPPDRKIRVLSISAWTQAALPAVRRAQAQGIFVISSSLAWHEGLTFHGLGRWPLADPDDTASYGPGSWWTKEAYEGAASLGMTTGLRLTFEDPILVPMDSRTTASPTGVSDYVFYRSGGWSWSIPYIAGLYALACQVDPGVTPERFWAAALDTGTPLMITTAAGSQGDLGRIVQPAALINRLAGQDSVPGLEALAGAETPEERLRAVADSFLRVFVGVAFLMAGWLLWRRLGKKLRPPPMAGGAK